MSSHATQPSACLLGLGSNLGDRQQSLDDAVAVLRENPQLSVVSVSPWYGTPAIGGPENQNEFLNGAVLLQTSLEPTQLLSVLHRMELHAGRTRSQRWAPRHLDLDLLLYGSRIQRAGAIVPHPWMAIRPFVLRPALDVAPEMTHPQLQLTIAQLWQLASRSTTIVAVLQSPDSENQAIDRMESILRRCADQASSHFVSLFPRGDVGRWPEGRIQSMEETAERVTSLLEPGTAIASLVVHGWWDQTILELDSKIVLSDAWIEKRAEIASTMPLPNVTIGLLPTEKDASLRDSARREFATRFDNYLASRPAQLRSPFLTIHEDANQVAHDINAILRGFAETNIRPVG